MIFFCIIINIQRSIEMRDFIFSNSGILTFDLIFGLII